jgi:hypothetical protein
MRGKGGDQTFDIGRLPRVDHIEIPRWDGGPVQCPREPADDDEVDPGL